MKRLQSVLSLSFLLTHQASIFFIMFMLACSLYTGCSSGKTEEANPPPDHWLLRLDVAMKSGAGSNVQSMLDSAILVVPGLRDEDKYRYYDLMSGWVAYKDSNWKGTTASPLSYLDSMLLVLNRSPGNNRRQRDYITIYQRKGEYYRDNRDFANAKIVIAQAMLISHELGDSCAMADNLRLLALTSYTMRRFQDAIVYYLQALPLLEFCNKDAQYFKKKQRWLDDLGFFYRETDRIDSAFHYHQQAEQFVKNNMTLCAADPVFPSLALQSIYINMAHAEIEKEEAAAAIYYVQKADSIIRNITHDSSGLIPVRIILANAFLLENDPYAAQQTINSIASVETAPEPGYILEYYYVKDKIARKLQKPWQALQALDNILQVKKRQQQTAVAAYANDPAREYENLYKQHQLELLQRDNSLQRNKTIATIIVAGLLLAGLCLGLYLMRKLSRLVINKDRLNRELQDAFSARSKMEKDLRERDLFVQEMELQMEFQTTILDQRRQISDDMHDELNSSLAALRYYATDLVAQARGTIAETPLSELQAEISNVYISARNYMYSLKNNDWQTRFSLTGFLKDIRQKFTQKKLMSVLLEIEEEDIKKRLTTYQHDQLYHIVKESISNIIRHANATELQVKIQFDESYCRFEIADNGKGFQEDKIEYGIGVRSMKSRIEHIGGNLKITTGSSGGAVVRGGFPVV